MTGPQRVYVDAMLGMSRCPRCGQEFDTTRASVSSVPAQPVVAICEPCGAHESDQAFYPGMVTPVTKWPIGSTARKPFTGTTEGSLALFKEALDEAVETVMKEDTKRGASRKPKGHRP